VEASSNSTESESVDERSTGSTETSSPVIKVYGSFKAMEAALEAVLEATLELETTEAEGWINPYGAEVKSKAKGIMEKDAPVSNTMGSIGTELEAVGAVAEATTVGATTVPTVAGTTEGVVVLGMSPIPIRVSNR